MTDELAIEVRDLRKTYREGLIFRRPFEVLKGVTFQVRRGEIFGLLGPNGAGKTTIIKVLLGIVRSSGGRATLLGRPAGDRTGRLAVGYLPENLRIPRHHNAMSAMAHYGRLSGKAGPEVRAKQEELLTRVGLAGRTSESVRKYSKGMVQRLGLAQALLHDPDLLILDEPTDGLDPLGRSDVRNILCQLREQGKTVFLNSHILQEVELICDRVAILDRGELRGVGRVEELDVSKAEGVELELEIMGPQPALKAALQGRAVHSSRFPEVDHAEVVVGLPDQAAVDCFVDDLRSRGLSIIRLNRRRISLEDAFLNILAKPS